MRRAAARCIPHSLAYLLCKVYNPPRPFSKESA